MVWSVQQFVLILLGLLLGVMAWQVDLATMTFARPTLEDIERFPIATYVGGMAVGLLLGDLARGDWRQRLAPVGLWFRKLSTTLAVAVFAVGTILIVLHG